MISLIKHIDKTVEKHTVKKSVLDIAIIIFMLSGLALAGAVQARVKCWLNNEGVRECGNVVPPEYSQKSHQEIGKSGLIKEETKRALTDKELEEQKRQEAIQAKKDTLAAEQKKKDAILLETFSSVQDIERARDERLTTLRSSIKLTQARSKKIQYKLDKRIEKAAKVERAGKTPSEALLKDIESLKRLIKSNDSFIEEKRKEREKIKKSHAADIEHFKKLKGIK